eukprot:CAMPEP_0176421788 /NCGR_PEP_ID=MMETSP0127-20121128/9372_1 /TAXON_ID=938130 /ORGANISM="Platyophrya macrostoma, Strain WH" /LENGTH=262 /DNA_ID=CAMNT_0017802565 /DNA_START=96 /DNA_END=884 /DNA_ORIENTATION=-
MRPTWIRKFVEYVPKNASALTGTARFRATEIAAERADEDVVKQGFYFLPKLKFPAVEGGVSPVLSARQFSYMYNVVHRDIVEQLNRHTIGSEFEGHTLEAVIRASAFDATKNAVHTPACEHFNYCFFYHSLRPWGTPMPADLREAIQLQYGSGESAEKRIQSLFLRAASTLQSRSGWVYLVWVDSGKLDVVPFEQGTTPLASDVTPLLCMSVNESTYGLDYSLATAEGGLEPYTKNFFKGCNWLLVAKYYGEATGRPIEPTL